MESRIKCQLVTITFHDQFFFFFWGGGGVGVGVGARFEGINMIVNYKKLTINFILQVMASR